MKRALGATVLFFSVIVVVQSQDATYKTLRPITDNTLYQYLYQNMQGYADKIFAAEAKLSALKGKGSFNRMTLCGLRYEIDSNVLLFMLKRWSTHKIILAAPSRNIEVHMARNWYFIFTNRAIYMFHCVFTPKRLVQDTITVTKSKVN
ncbi:uncharacterized protein LOC128987977 [Macrosteles quadrilineatus]|uniref:uncharacterized protein LOC128987977 n=1 Tax=Macrosteles quadrilineatus TaxID=74068 RepID=UPI0023E23B21|nr:uncharacterized protein LOC128987977 [Macrosteles quadrilineatus]